MLSFHIKIIEKTYIIAHRGASSYEYENTIVAFQKAIELGADGIELDVRKTKDNVLVVHHDDTLKNIDIRISEMTYKDIQKYNVSSDYLVPTLEEVLIFCKDKIALDIELKEYGYEESVVELTLKYFERENLLFSSFEKKSLEQIHNIDNGLLVGYLFLKPIMVKTIPEFVDFVLPHYSLCKIGYLKKLEKIGKPIIVWTVDKISIKEKFIKNSIFGLITNDPL